MTSKSSKNNVTKLKALTLGGALALSLCFQSCESIYDNDADCKTGLSLAFIYDYHMEPGANAFPANVDCVDVLVFDKEGNYLTQLYETSEELKNENYRMELPLEPGDYELVVYGGLACANPEFDFTHSSQTGRAGGHKNTIKVALKHTDGISNRQLHNIEKRTGGLFYAKKSISIDKDERATTYREEVVNVMKNTNNIQVILQELSSPYSIDYNDYNFYIIDDNFNLDGENKVIGTLTDTYKTTYMPYSNENRIMGLVDTSTSQAVEDESKPVQVACVEFSTSRLLMDNIDKAHLIVTSKKEKDLDGSDKTIIDIPLITYLTAIRGNGDTWIKSDQEFLDRQSRWNLMFFLQRNVWVSARVVVNSWVVRINNEEF